MAWRGRNVKKELYVAIYHHEYGVDSWAFWFIPQGDLTHPSPRSIAEYLAINFEPDKGETFELIHIPGGMATFEAAAMVLGSNPERRFGRSSLAPADWYEEKEEGWNNVDESNVESFPDADAQAGERAAEQ